MIKAVIFDMDGLLFDTEHKWQELEHEFAKSVGITITRDMQKMTLGLRTNEVIRYWYNYKPWENPDLERSEREIEDKMLDYYLNEAVLMKGARYILDFFKSLGIKTAIASSSSMVLIDAFINKFKLQCHFAVKHSAESEEYGKPHPGVYISTAKMLDFHPSHCLAFEDSFNGLLAAKSAMTKAVAVPDPDHFRDLRFSIADMKIRNLEEFGDKEWEAINKL